MFQSDHYYSHLFHVVQSQQKEIEHIKKSMRMMSEELKTLKERPSVTVERLEYKFDQLKVETLEGTLHIGINPGDLKAIEDLALPSSGKKHTPSFHHLMNNLNAYIDQDLPHFIQDMGAESGRDMKEAHIEMVKEDVRKQLPAKAEHYMHFFRNQANKPMSEEDLHHKIYEKLISDMNTAVERFFAESKESDAQGDEFPHGT